MEREKAQQIAEGAGGDVRAFMAFFDAEDHHRRFFDGKSRTVWVLVGLECFAAHDIPEATQAWKDDHAAHWVLHLYVQFTVSQWAQEHAAAIVARKAHTPRAQDIAENAADKFVMSWWSQNKGE